MRTDSQIKEYHDAFADVCDIKHGIFLYGQAHNFRTYYKPFLRRILLKEGKVPELGCGTAVGGKVGRGIGQDIWLKIFHDEVTDLLARNLDGLENGVLHTIRAFTTVLRTRTARYLPH
jgi:hypothetical protein